jgi:hypothetical protein
MLDGGLDQPASRSVFPKNFFTTRDTGVDTRTLPRRAESALSVRRARRLDLVARQCPPSKRSEPWRRGRPMCTERVANPGKHCTRGGAIEAATSTQRFGAFSPGGGEARSEGKIVCRPVRRTLQFRDVSAGRIPFSLSQPREGQWVDLILRGSGEEIRQTNPAAPPCAPCYLRWRDHCSPS